MKRILSIVVSFSILWMLTSCVETTQISQNSNTPSQIDSATNTTEDSTSVHEDSKPSKDESNVSQKPESSNNSISNNNSTTKPSANNSTSEEPSVDKGPANVGYNPNLTWEEAYVDNGDGTFQLTFVDGEVVTYVPHPTVEGTYRRKDSDGLGGTFEQIKYIWDVQWCKHCGSCDPLHHRYGIDITCYDCGEMAKANTCHICGKN